MESVGDLDLRIILVHCDAHRPSVPYEKGFLELGQEIDAVREIEDPRMGIAVNWGRTAIEGREAPGGAAAFVTEQIALAAELKVLRGLMFPGVVGTAGVWGPAWEDSHIAPRGDSEALSASHASLLGEPEIRAAIAAAGDGLSYLGAKITVLNAETSVERCLEVARETLALVRR